MLMSFELALGTLRLETMIGHVTLQWLCQLFLVVLVMVLIGQVSGSHDLKQNDGDYINITSDQQNGTTDDMEENDVYHTSIIMEKLSNITDDFEEIYENQISITTDPQKIYGNHSSFTTDQHRNVTDSMEENYGNYTSITMDQHNRVTDDIEEYDAYHTITTDQWSIVTDDIETNYGSHTGITMEKWSNISDNFEKDYGNYTSINSDQGKIVGNHTSSTIDQRSNVTDSMEEIYGNHTSITTDQEKIVGNHTSITIDQRSNVTDRMEEIYGNHTSITTDQQNRVFDDIGEYDAYQTITTDQWSNITDDIEENYGNHTSTTTYQRSVSDDMKENYGNHTSITTDQPNKITDDMEENDENQTSININQQTTTRLDKRPFVLVETTSIKWVWDDRLSWFDDDISIWRADVSVCSGCHSLNDIAVKSHTQPKSAFVVRLTNPNDENSLRLPISFTKIWDDNGSRGWYDVTIWRVNCETGFVALGDIATSGDHPAIDTIYCVNMKYVFHGSNNFNWKTVWEADDEGSEDVKIYEAKSATATQLTVKGFKAISSLSRKPGRPYLLNKAYFY